MGTTLGAALWRWAAMNLPPFSSRLSRLVLLVAPALLTLAGTALLAQSGPLPPPPLMMFYREEVKPGHGAAHAALRGGVDLQGTHGLRSLGRGPLEIRLLHFSPALGESR